MRLTEMHIGKLLKLISAFIITISILVTGCTGAPSSSPFSSSSATAVKTEQPKPATPQAPSAQITSTPQLPLASAALPAVPKTAGNSPFPGTIILGSPTADSIALSLLNSADTDAYIEYGKSAGNFSLHTGVNTLLKDQPLQIDIPKLEKDTQYYFRVCHRVSGQPDYSAGTDSTFHTQRAVGSTFSFAVQGDSHPERINQMYNADLYLQTMNNVKTRNPDFYFALGDDFSFESIIGTNQLSQEAVNKVYANQRGFLGVTGSPLFLGNGNHEAGAKYLLDGTPNNAAVLAGKARGQYFALPAPGAFYSGDTENIPFIGPLKDYYAWTWGDALFVVIDFYWHSPVAVDNPVGGGNKRSSMWDITLGETQYKWFEQTLATSTAKHKFVFSHHVLGTERGSTVMAGLYEWGGKNQSGVLEFAQMRPGWDLPIHQLMAKYGVTIFFQGHDHVFARQELDGVVYQTVPVPADPNYLVNNSQSYTSGDLLSNSGFLNVTVSADQVKVDYIRSYLAKDETGSKKNGQIAFSYTR